MLFFCSTLHGGTGIAMCDRALRMETSSSLCLTSLVDINYTLQTNSPIKQTQTNSTIKYVKWKKDKPFIRDYNKCDLGFGDNIFINRH